MGYPLKLLQLEQFVGTTVRNEEDMAAEQVALELGVDQRTIDRWESGDINDRQKPKANTPPPDFRVKLPPDKKLLLVEKAQRDVTGGDSATHHMRIRQKGKLRYIQKSVKMSMNPFFRLPFAALVAPPLRPLRPTLLRCSQRFALFYPVKEE